MMLTPPEDRLRDAALLVADQIAREVGAEPGEIPIGAIVAFALAERADAAREAEAATWRAAREIAERHAVSWLTASRNEPLDSVSWHRCEARRSEASDLMVAFEHRLAAREAAPVTPGKGKP